MTYIYTLEYTGCIGGIIEVLRAGLYISLTSRRGSNGQISNFYYTGMHGWWAKSHCSYRGLGNTYGNRSENNPPSLLLLSGGDTIYPLRTHHPPYYTTFKRPYVASSLQDFDLIPLGIFLISKGALMQLHIIILTCELWSTEDEVYGEVHYSLDVFCCSFVAAFYFLPTK